MCALDQKDHIFLLQAKNIAPYPGPNKMRDCYCTVNLDQEEVFRTKIIEKSLCPFYGEDFYCEIPRSFRHLCFYIFDRDVFRRDSSIGKVAVKKEDLTKYHGKDTWFPLQPVSADSEVQGKVHLELRLSEVITDSGAVCHKLATRVLECQDLPIVNGQCDPYAAVSLLGPSRSEAKKTKVKRKTNNPQFDEVFYFEVRTFRKKKGEKKWYFLQPRDNGSKSVKADELGSLRLNIVYTEDHVFSSERYNPLTELLLHSAHVEPVSASAAHVLGEVCREKQEAAVPLVHLFLHYGKIVPFVSAIASAEVNRTQDPNTIFRGNSLTSKCIDETMKLAGMHYLQVTLKPIIDEICTEHKPCEIDPVKLKESENLETNRENLRQYVDRIFNVITTSGVRCPTVMCDIFFSLRESAATRFQVDQDVRYTAVSSFIFLRFFAPAILSPNLFQLRPHHPVSVLSNYYTNTTLTICSALQMELYKQKLYKQNFTNGTDGNKWNWQNQKYADAVKNVSVCCPWVFWDVFLSVTLFMIKRAQGRNRFGMKNFKKRWFRLTNHEFTYHKTKAALCSIPIENILAVERLEEESFKMKNMFQVIQPERALYIQANNCVEARDWIDILTKVSQCNRKRLSTYHPSAYLNGHWLCCKQSVDCAPGCTPCTGGLPANIQLDIDGDRETERIYSLFSTYMSKLVKMQEACGSKSVYDGPEQEEYSSFVIDDPQQTYKTLKQIISAVQTLEQQHAQYKRDKFRKTKYGSQ
uniref:RAS p21 protein activator 3 n=1 Tax=Electrophorus electricus TaxID=8005 RepID=A0A4W4FQE5_ELEEL